MNTTQSKLSLPLLDTFRQITHDHPLWNHAFLVKCRSENLTIEDVKVLAGQMYKFCKEFSRILSHILACCSDVDIQLVILSNLLDETGLGNPHMAHPELFRRFTRALGIDDLSLEAIPANPETTNLIDTYFNLGSEYGYLAALGAVCFTSEGIVNSLYAQLQTGILSAQTFPKESLIFFDLHIDLDGDHALKMATLLETKITSTEEAMNINRAIVKAMDARYEYFNGIQRQASQVTALDRVGLSINI
jgi:pyrroloquinoline-quinone synthase